jgi:hypothetical protein
VSYFDAGSVAGPLVKTVSLRVLPTPTGGGHVGIAANCTGLQPFTPEVAGPGVGFWTHANGIFWNAPDSGIYAEVWHINPGTSEPSWQDNVRIGTWIPGHAYQVDIHLFAGGEFVFEMYDLTYARDYTGQPSNTAMRQFFSTAASPTAPTPAERVRAKSVYGRTSKVAAFIAGTGSQITVTPTAVFN